MSADSMPDSTSGGWTRPERITAELVLGLLSWALAGLALALVGFFHWWAVVPLSLALWAAARRLLPKPESRFDAWWVAAFALAMTAAVFNASFPAEHVSTGRDSGTYLATAGWLAESGGLTVDAGAGPLGEHEDLNYIVPGFYDIGIDRVLEPQFMHAYPAMVGTLIDIFGLPGAFVVNPIVSGILLLALFGLARRFVRPFWALLAMVVLGAGLVFVYYARAPFTEPLMAVFVVAGIWLVGLAEQRLDGRVAWLAGALLGAATLVRLDGIVLLPPIAGYLLVRGSLAPEVSHLMVRVRQMMFAVALIGLGESLLVSPPYVLDRSSQVVPVLVGLLIVLVLHRVFQSRIVSISDWVRRRRKLVMVAGASVLLVLLSYGWFVRPLVGDSAGGGYGLESIEKREGIDPDANIDYADLSVQWITWYQGAAFLVLAAIGCIALMSEMAGDRGSRERGWLPLIVLVSFSLLYFWRPSVNPDHIWAMRRFLTVILPLGALMAAVAVDRLGSMGSRAFKSDTAEWVAGAALGLLLVVPAVASTVPVWNLAELSGLASDFTDVCDELGPNAQVLFLDDESGDLGHRFAQSFRSYCGFPTAWGGAALSSDELDDLATEVEDAGGRLVLADASDGGDSDRFTSLYPVLELTLTRAPSDVGAVDLSISLRPATSGA